MMKFFILSILMISCAHQRTIKENIEGINQAEKETEIQREGEYVYAVDDSLEKGGEVIASDLDSKYSLSMLGTGREAFSFIGLLKEIEQDRIKIIGLSGRGTAALVAGLYAKYGKANMVEWIIFKYLNRFFPFEKSFVEDYREAGKKLIRREFKNLKDSSFKLAFKNPTSMGTHQFIENEFLKENEDDRYTYAESSCVHESALYQNFINLCFFSSRESGYKHDDIDRKSFGLKWYENSNLPLVDIIESKSGAFARSLRSL